MYMYVRGSRVYTVVCEGLQLSVGVVAVVSGCVWLCLVVWRSQSGCRRIGSVCVCVSDFCITWYLIPRNRP